MEIIITIGIVVAALFIICKNVKTSAKGKCNCGSCSKNCPSRREEKQN